MNNQFVPQGWECPKCKRVYSPTTLMCIACPQFSGFTSSETIPISTSTTTSCTTSTRIHNFVAGKGTSKTKCALCGLEKWQHPIISFT